MVSRPQRGHHLLGAQLLLPLRQPSRHPGGQRASQVQFHTVRPGAATRRAAHHAANTRVLPLSGVCAALRAPPAALRARPRKEPAGVCAYPRHDVRYNSLFSPDMAAEFVT